MLNISKIAKFKNRIIISLIFGVISVLTYFVILEHNGFEINEYNVFVLFMLPAILFKVYILGSGIIFSVLTLTLIIISGKSKSRIFQFLISFLIVIFILNQEYQKTISSNLYDSTKNEKLVTDEVYNLYLKALKHKDMRAISSLAGHKNISDSLELVLSNYEDQDVRQSIGWNSDSKSLLIKLSKDNDYEVRAAVASNMNTPLDIVYSLINDSNEEVKNTAFSMYQARKK
jgi:hypothetical protein